MGHHFSGVRKEHGHEPSRVAYPGNIYIAYTYVYAMLDASNTFPEFLRISEEIIIATFGKL